MDLFYAHLVPLDDSLSELSQFQLSEQERLDLENLILSMYHHRIIDTILTVIDNQHHDRIVAMIAGDPHDLAIMVALKQLNSDIEDHIMLAGKTLSSELTGLLAQSRSTKSRRHNTSQDQ